MRSGRSWTWPETTSSDPRTRRQWRIFGCGLALVIFLLIVVAISL